MVEIGKVSEAEAVARHTPVPDGDEAAAPTIDNWFEDVIEHRAGSPAPSWIRRPVSTRSSSIPRRSSPSGRRSTDGWWRIPADGHQGEPPRSQPA